MTKEQRLEISAVSGVKEAFIAGFNMSGEGFNAEYGCDTHEVEAMAETYSKDLVVSESCLEIEGESK